MIVYKVVSLFGRRNRYIKERISDKNKRKHTNFKRYRRWWFWHKDKWNQRHGIKD